MVDITMASRYQRGYDVRKRQVGHETYLIRLTNICKLDAMGVSIWGLLDGKKNFYQITLELAKLSEFSDEDRVIELVAKNFISLLNLGYISESDNFLNDFSHNLFKSMELSCLDTIMQSCYCGSDLWYASVATLDKDKIRSRFFRIIYEMESSRRINIFDDSISHEDFLGNIFTEFIVSEQDCISSMKEKFELKAWRFDLPSNSITIVYMDTVYFGDLDNRL